MVDVCRVLSESVDPGAYWRKLKPRLEKEGNEVVTFCHGLKLRAVGGKRHERVKKIKRWWRFATLHFKVATLRIRTFCTHPSRFFCYSCS